MDLIGKCLAGLILLTIWCRVLENIDFVEPILKQSGYWLFEFSRFVVKTCITFGFWTFMIILVYNIFWFIFCSQLRHIENPFGSEPTLKYDGGGRPIPANVRWSNDKPWWDWEIIPRLSEANIINFCNRFKQTQDDNQKFLQNMQHVIPTPAVSKDVLNSTLIRPSRSRNYRTHTTTTSSQFKELENISPIRRPADTFSESVLRAQIQKQMEIQEQQQQQRLAQAKKQQIEQQHQQYQQKQQYTKQNHFNPNYNNGSGDQLINYNSGIWKRNSQINSISSSSKPSNDTISSFTRQPEHSWYNYYSQNIRK